MSSTYVIFSGVESVAPFTITFSWAEWVQDLAPEPTAQPRKDNRTKLKPNWVLRFQDKLERHNEYCVLKAHRKPVTIKAPHSMAQHYAKGQLECALPGCGRKYHITIGDEPVANVWL